MSPALQWFFFGLLVYGTVAIGIGAVIQHRLKRRRSTRVLTCISVSLAIAAASLVLFA